MTAGLGIAVGTANSRAAVLSDSGSATGEPAFVATSRPSVLHVSPDGSVAFADSSSDPAGTPVAGFVERVGDPVGLLDDAGCVHLGDDLFVAAVAELIDAAPGTGAVTVTHPTAWSSYTVHALESALDRAGLQAALVVPEATACVRWLESSRDLQGDGVAVVYDLGASSLDVTVVRVGVEPSILGKPIRSEDFGGAHFDHQVTRYVLDTVSEKTGELDPFDTATTTALADLRRNCAAAKESLSTDTETVIPVALPGYVTDVRLVRSELEDLIRPALVNSLELVREALRSAEIEVSDVGCVLLAGGGGAIPLVAELVSSELGLTVVAAPNPALTAALGAAHLAVDEPASAAATTVFPDYEHTADDTAVVAVVPSFPSRMRSPRSGSTTRRRIAIVVSAAAAIGVLTAGGLSIGTASKQQPAQSNSSATGTSTPSGGATTTAGATTGAGATGGATSGGAGETVTVGHAGTGGTVTADSGRVRTADTGRSTAAQGPTPGAPGAAPVVPESAPTPGDQAPGGAVAPPAPVYNPPAPGGGVTNPLPPGPSAADVGEGIGKAATGVGAGLGAAVTGIGTGVGNIVGAVVDPVTGLLIGK
ncbi:Hsp70 family protein [Prescottella agglutinans]|uniref:Actin-like ATPase involved in cell morphogenesis n=1 Tax=Prescottella agglutinans TaxID=1644129 RepID=A0ABT6M9H9_9NOCA|nr:Hsp70 family protein [Prescottella agglutinans]MDH6280535.1 actin-like ATPase involved in cell morphogenesis [Prescottella agglutinans]